MTKHELPDLPYNYDALEPHIDEQTMRIHHTKHHQGYINKYIKAVEGTEYEEEDVNDVLAKLDSLPSELKIAVRNAGGGYSNHSLFWEIMSPEGGEPEGELLKAIEDKFDSFENFKKEFSEAAGSVFGSGWAWLTIDEFGELDIETTSNQDTPVSKGRTPILGLDVWEHSYYKKYGPGRGEYIQAWWNVVNWEKVAENFEAAKD